MLNQQGIFNLICALTPLISQGFIAKFDRCEFNVFILAPRVPDL